MNKTGWKTVTSTMLSMIYVAGLLFQWWQQNEAAEAFILALFSLGISHKIVKARSQSNKKNE